MLCSFPPEVMELVEECVNNKGLSDYELKRLERIQENKKLVQSFGIY